MKKRITRKMKRELKNAVNPLEELLIIIKQYFPKLTNWINNINHILKTDYVELPHKDTLINVFSSIKFEDLEKIQTNIIKTFIHSKMLDKYRFNRFFYIVIDGTGLYSTIVNLGE